MRLEITKKTDLALRALGVLDGEGRLKGSALADRIGTTSTYIAQVMTPLVQAGWVDSEPGPTGGYRLTSQLGDISFLELIEAVEGPTDSGRCVLRTGPCPGEDVCAVHEAWMRARTALLDELDRTSLAVATRRTEVHR